MRGRPPREPAPSEAEGSSQAQRGARAEYVERALLPAAFDVVLTLKTPNPRRNTSVTHLHLKIVAKLASNSPPETFPCDFQSMSI
jgi:hypothetical protein